ncbi:MAG: hypothetical protein AAFR22_20030, partial [Chloroflexota bacterium]
MTEQKRQKVHKPDDVTFEQTENGIRIRWQWWRVDNIWWSSIPVAIALLVSGSILFLDSPFHLLFSERM